METFKNETELVNYLIHRLNAAGNFVWRNNTGAMPLFYTNKKGIQKRRFLHIGMKGASDILGVSKSGKFVGIEAKYGKNKTTQHQDLFLQEVTNRGGIAVIARSWEDIPDELKDGDK